VLALSETGRVVWIAVAVIGTIVAALYGIARAIETPPDECTTCGTTVPARTRRCPIRGHVTRRSR
jgi:hypothetical protein